MAPEAHKVQALNKENFSFHRYITRIVLNPVW